MNGGLLFRNRVFGLFWLGRVVSYFGNAVALVALVLHVEDVTGSGVAVGVLLLAGTAPQVMGPLAGAVVDRAEGRRLMVLCDVGQAGLIGAAAVFLPPLPILVSLVAGSSVLSTLFRPAGRSAVPDLVSSEDLTSANALLGSAFNSSMAVGPALGGLAFAFSGARGALAFDALTFVFSAALLSRLPKVPVALAGQLPETRLIRESWDGVRYVLRHREVGVVALALFLGVACVAVDGVALVFLVEDALGSGGLGYGLAVSAHGAGMVLGPLLLVRRWGVARLAPAAIVLAGLALEGTATFLIGFAPVLAVAVVFRAVGGIGNGMENVAADVLVQRVVPREMLGRVFGVVYAGITLAEGLAYLIWGLLLELFSPRVVFVLGGCGALAAMLLAWRLLAREPTPG